MSKEAQSVMLAQTWKDTIDPTGYWMSEKLDGVRAYWNGKNFYSRQGNLFYAPKFFRADLPKCPLDGELWCGRGLFQKCVSIVKTKLTVNDEDWKYVTYLVFDAPAHKGTYEERVEFLKTTIKSEKETTYAAVVGIKKCEGVTQLKKALEEVMALGGEGLMLREPGSHYECKRSHTLLKVKTFRDEEALVTGHERGEGRCAGMMGALSVKLPNGVTFSIGTGFTDKQRKKPPKIGTVITFKYQELSDSGHPRFPVYLRERTDMTWEDVLKEAKKNIPFSSKPKEERTLKKQHSILYSVIPSRDQETGRKIITDDDSLDASGEEEKKASKTDKKVCMYGEACYRTDASHVSHYWHPSKKNNNGDAAAAPASAATTTTTTTTTTSSSSSSEEPAKIPCQWGKACYRTSKEHTDKYSHPEPDAEGEKQDEEEEEGNNKELDGTQVMEDWMASFDADEGYMSDTYLKEGDTAVITTKEWLDLQAVVKAQGERIKALEEALALAQHQPLEQVKRKRADLQKEEEFVVPAKKENKKVVDTKKRKLGN